MRAPLKYLAPLILLPFLACADTPAEPESDTLFAKGKPEPPPVGEPYSGFSAMCGMLDPGVYTEDDRYAHLRDAVMR